jgi:hypothetical protein
MMKSRLDIRWPGRESTRIRNSPSRVSHQNRSLPANRCGNTGIFVPIDRSTWRPAVASSPAIWTPELPPPTASTGPGGSACGLR